MRDRHPHKPHDAGKHADRNRRDGCDEDRDDAGHGNGAKVWPHAHIHRNPVQHRSGDHDGGREPCGDLGSEPPIAHESPSDQPNRQGNGDRRQNNGHPVDCLDGGKTLVAGE